MPQFQELGLFIGTYWFFGLSPSNSNNFKLFLWVQLSIPLNRILVITPSSLRTITALKQEFKFRTGFLIGQNVIYVNLRHLWSHNGNLLMRKSWNFLVDGLGRIKIQNNIFRPRVVAKERDHIYFYCYCMVAIQRTAV